MGTTAPARSTLGAMPGSGRGCLERSRGAFDDRGPYAWPAPSRIRAAPGTAAKTRLANHNVGVGLQRAAERLRGHLADKTRSLV